MRWPESLSEVIDQVESAGSHQARPDALVTRVRVRWDVRAWLKPDEIKQGMTEVFAVRILDAYEPGGPRVRSHDGVNLLDLDEAALPLVVPALRGLLMPA